MIVTGIKWKTWTSASALGAGIYSQNMCNPYCTEGTRVEVRVDLKLSGLFEHKGRSVLKTLVISAISRRESPNDEKNMTLDLAEFVAQMNWVDSGA